MSNPQGSPAERAASTARDAKADFDEAVADLSESEAVQGARGVGRTLADALEESIRKRPYTTLAVAGLIGFLYGAMRRR